MVEERDVAWDILVTLQASGGKHLTKGGQARGIALFDHD